MLVLAEMCLWLILVISYINQLLKKQQHSAFFPPFLPPSLFFIAVIAVIH